MPAILAKKLGMSQLFLKDERVERVTVLEAGPCPVTGIRTLDRDGYVAVQLAFGLVKEKHLSKPELGPGERLLAHGAERQLDGLVAVELVRADPGHRAVTQEIPWQQSRRTTSAYA